LNTAAAAGDEVQVCMLGICPVKVNTTISKGDKINSAAATGLVAVAGATEMALGVAMQAATAQNDEILCFVNSVWYAT
jgi:hypothetical protein